MFILSLGILGLVVGYGTVVLRGGVVSASGVSCPMKHEVCANGDCSKHEACENGKCDKTCPGCQKNV